MLLHRPVVQRVRNPRCRRQPEGLVLQHHPPGAAEDLALDLWVAPDGEMLVLDEDEFAALALPPAEHDAAQQALAELQAMVRRKAPPFDGRDDDG